MEINEAQEKLLKVLGEIGNDLFKAISEFLLKECFLLKHDINERSITHKLAEFSNSILFISLSDEISCLKKSYASGISLFLGYSILCNGKKISFFYTYPELFLKPIEY